MTFPWLEAARYADSKGRVRTFVGGIPFIITADLSLNGFAAAAGGGMDVRIKPWLSWRTQGTIVIYGCLA